MTKPVAGVCQFCHITDDEVDGSRRSWLDDSRTCCNGFACIKANREKLARAKAQRPRPRTPADIHRLIVEERKAKAKRYREAAKLRKMRRIA